MKGSYFNSSEGNSTLYDQMIQKHQIEQEKNDCSCNCHSKNHHQSSQERIIRMNFLISFFRYTMAQKQIASVNSQFNFLIFCYLRMFIFILKEALYNKFKAKILIKILQSHGIYLPECSTYSFLSIFIPYVVAVLIHICKAIYTAKQYSQHDQSSNNQKIDKLNQKDQNIIQPKTIQWKNIELGDIVKIESGERAPADLVILDSYDKNFFVDSNSLDGKSIPAMKFSLKLTYVSRQNQDQKEKFQNFRRKLVGKLQYRVNFGEQSYYSGSFKLKSDPTSENITTENILYKNTILHNTKWIYGMVIGTGCDCQMDKWKKKTMNKQSIMDEMIEKFSSILIIIFTLLSILMRILVQEQSYKDFSYLNDVTTPDIRIDIRSFWVQFLVGALPLHIFAVSDIIQVIEAKKLERKYKGDVQIKNIAALENIAFVDWCLFDKTQTLTQNNFEIEGFIIDQSFFNAKYIKNVRLKSLNKDSSSDYENPKQNRLNLNLAVNTNFGHKLNISQSPTNSQATNSQGQGGSNNQSGMGVLNLKNRVQMVQTNFSDNSLEAKKSNDKGTINEDPQQENSQEANAQQINQEEYNDIEFQKQIQDKMKQIKLQIEKIDEAGESILANSSQIESLDKHQIQYQKKQQSMNMKHSQYGGQKDQNKPNQLNKQNKQDQNTSNDQYELSVSRQQSLSDQRGSPNDYQSQNSDRIKKKKNKILKNSSEFSPVEDRLSQLNNILEQNQFELENQDTNRQLITHHDNIHSENSQRQKNLGINGNSSNYESEYESSPICESPNKNPRKQQDNQNQDDLEEIASEGYRANSIKSFQLHFEGVSLPCLDSDRTNTGFQLSTRYMLNPSQNMRTEEDYLVNSNSNIQDLKISTPSLSHFNKKITNHQRKFEMVDNANLTDQLTTEQENQNILTNKYEEVNEEDEINILETSHSEIDETNKKQQCQDQIKFYDLEQNKNQKKQNQEINDDQIDSLHSISQTSSKEEEEVEEQKSDSNNGFENNLVTDIEQNNEIKLTCHDNEDDQLYQNSDLQNSPNVFKNNILSQGKGDQEDVDSLQLTSDQIRESEINSNNIDNKKLKSHSRSSSSSSKMKSSSGSPQRLSKFAQKSIDFTPNPNNNNNNDNDDDKLHTPPKLLNHIINQQLEGVNNLTEEKNEDQNIINNQSDQQINNQTDIQSGGQINLNTSPTKSKKDYLYQKYQQNQFFINTGQQISFQKLGSGVQSFNGNGGAASIDSISGLETPVMYQNIKNLNPSTYYNDIVAQQDQIMRENWKQVFNIQINNSPLGDGETNSSKAAQTPQLFQSNSDGKNIFKISSKESYSSPLHKQLSINQNQTISQNLNYLDFAQSKNLVSSQSMKQQMRDSIEKNPQFMDSAGLQHLKETIRNFPHIRNLYDSDFSQDHQVDDFQIIEKEQLIQQEQKNYDNFVKAVMICRQWKLKVLPNSDFYSIEFLKPEDESISRFFRHLKITLQVGTKRELEGKCYFHLPNLNENNKLQIIVQNYPSPKRPNAAFSIVQDHFFGTYRLYVKGDVNLLDKMKLRTQQKQVLTKYFESKMESGQRVQVYGSRDLIYKQVQNFLIKYHQVKASHFDDQTRQYDELFAEIELDLEYLGVLFMSNNLNKGVVNYVNQMDNLLIKMAVLSGDTHDYVMQTAKSSTILEDEMENIKIEGENHDDIESSIKQHISQIKKQMFSQKEEENEFLEIPTTTQQEDQQQPLQNSKNNNNSNGGLSRSKSLKNYSKRVTKTEHYNYVQNAFKQSEKKRAVIVKGSQLKVISSNPTLEAHFIFLIANADRIIGSELTAIQKGYFVEMIKHIDQRTKIMSIGDGYNDCLMMQLSDISIELSSSNSFQLQQQNKQKEALQNKNQNQSQIKNTENNNQLKVSAQKTITSKQQITLTKQESIELKKKQSSMLAQDLIEIKTKMSNNSGDIFIKSPDFSILQRFLISESFNLSRKKHFIIVEAFYQSFLYLILNFSLNFYTLSSSTLFNSVDHVVFYILLFGIKLIFFGNKFSNELVSILTEKHAPIIYNYNFSFLQRASSSISFFLMSIIPAIFDSIIILLVAVFSQTINDSTDLLRSFIFLNLILVNSIRLHNNIPDENLEKINLDDYRQSFRANLKSNNSRINEIKNSKDDKKITSLEDAVQNPNKSQHTEQFQFKKQTIKFFNSNLLKIIIFDLVIYFAYFGFNYEYSKRQSLSPQQAFNIRELLSQSEFYIGLFFIVTTQKIFYFYYNYIVKRYYLDKEISALLNFFKPKNFVWREFYKEASEMISYHQISIENVIKKIFSKVRMDINVEQSNILLINSQRLKFNFFKQILVLSPDDYHQQMEQDEYNKYTLQFISKKLMAQYNKIMVPQSIKQARSIIIALIILNILLIIFTSIFNEQFESVTENQSVSNIASLLLLIIFTVLLFFFVIILYTKLKEDNFQYINISILLYIGLYELIYPWAFNQVLTFKQMILFLVISFLPLPVQLIFSHHILISLNQIIWKLKEEKSQSSDILGLLLPEFVKDEVNQCQGEYLIEKSSDNVLILFCDIYQFDKILSEEKERITDLLDNIFRQFDMLCKQEGIQKIETVGKTYMACGGLKDIEKRLPKEVLKYDVSERIINLAIQMIIRASLIIWGENDEHQGIALKIGINSGPVIAGVIGLHKPQFSLIGDTVNTTSRICANCKEGLISISQKVYERVKGIKPDWGFKQHTFEAKGKGTLVCYYINLRDESALIQPLSGMKGQNQMLISKTPLVMLKSLNNQERLIQGLQTRNQTSYQIPINTGLFGGGVSSHSLQNSQNLQIKLMDVQLNDKMINRNRNQKKKTVYLNDLLDDELSSPNKSKYQNSEANGIGLSPSLMSPPLNKENQSMDESIKKYHRDDFVRESLEQKPVGNQLVPKTVIFTSVETPVKAFKKKIAQELSLKVPTTTNEERASQNGISETSSKINIVKIAIPPNSQQGQQQISSGGQINVVQAIPDQEDTDEEDDDKFHDINNSRSFIFNQKSEEQGTRITVNRFLQYRINGDKQIHNDYEEKTLQYYWKPFQVLIISTIIVNFLHTIIKLSSKKQNSSQNAIWYAIDFTCQASFFLFIMIRDLLLSKKKMRLTFLIIININFIAIVGDASLQNVESMLIHFSIMRLTCNFYLMSHSYCLQFFEQLFLSIFWGLAYIFWVLVPDNKFSIQYLYLIFCSIFFLLYQRYNFVRTEITCYNKFSIEIEQKNKQLNLLINLLPPHILQQFFKDTTKRSEFTHRLKNVPILVADIAGFTAYSNSVQPTQVVKMLYNLFIKFDLSCRKHRVFKYIKQFLNKVYTIGDCYMVLGFQDTQMRNFVDEAHNTLEMAFSMVKIIQKVKKEINFDGLNMRIGLHIGDIIGGVIGTDIVRYDVYGKDVVVANKMESNSTTGRIRISESYKKILEDNYSSLYEFEDEQTVECPSIDQILQSWLVYKKDEA